MEGTVKWFSGRKGFGFIQGEDGKDYFVHHSALPEGARIDEGDKVSFEPTATDKGEQAQKVKLLEKSDKPQAEEEVEEDIQE